MGCDHAIKFARWQHPAVGNLASFAVPAPLASIKLELLVYYVNELTLLCEYCRRLKIKIVYDCSKF